MNFDFLLGTCAFGALILAFIKLLRVLLEWFEEKIKGLTKDNYLTKFIICCCKCCMWCLENFVRFINKNAYIMTSIYGYNFCTGARKSFVLLTENAARAVVLNKVTSFVLFIGKLCVLLIVSSVTYFLFSYRVMTDLDIHPNYEFVPMFIIILGTYAIATTFFSVYDMAVDTIFLCFLMDLDKHDGSEEKPYFMNKNLKKILDVENEIMK